MKKTFQPIWRVLVAALTAGSLMIAPVVEAKSRQSSRAVAAKKANAKSSKKTASVRKSSKSRLASKQRSSSRKVAARKIAPAKARMARAPEVNVQRVSWAPSLDAHQLDGPNLIANVALAYNEQTGSIDYAKNINRVVSIASITKLMTAMVILDAKLDMDEVVTITQADVIASEGTRSRLQVGYGLTRAELIKISMLVSDNRAAVALGRTYPGGMEAFVARMNRKARSIGMTQAQFYEPSGLHAGNVAAPADIVKMVEAAYDYPLLRNISATMEAEILPFGADHAITFRNTNQLVRDPQWQIGISKTGFIRVAGHCLVMHATVANAPYVLIVMDSSGNRSREADAARIKRWLEYKAGVHSSSS